jgi:hypothetical protein
MAELSTVSAAAVYNQVYHIQKPDYTNEVAEESKKAFVLVLLTSSQETNVPSRITIEIWRDLARKFGDVKFCQMRADLCIDGYPDQNTPTILVYHKGDIARQIVTLRELNGLQTKLKGRTAPPRGESNMMLADFEQLLVELGAVKDGDSRLSKEEGDGPQRKSGGIRDAKKTLHDDDDSDWE